MSLLLIVIVFRSSAETKQEYGKTNNCSINQNFYEAVIVYYCTIKWNLRV